MRVAKISNFAAWTVAAMPRKCWWFFVPCLVAAFWPRLALVRLYDPDEFEHLHAAWCVSQGQIPYLDFFEHHGPLTYYLLAPLVSWVGDTPVLLSVHRALAGFWCLCSIVGVFLLVRRRSLSAFGIALTWLFTFPWFLEKAVEGRPDVPAMALLTFAALFTRTAAFSERWTWMFAAGLTAGVASLFTQKVVFAGAGLAIGACITRVVNRRSPIRAIVMASAGFLTPWIVASTFFYSHDALASFLERTLVTPAVWPAHVRKPDEGILNRLNAVVSWAPGHLAVLAFVVLMGFARLANRSRWSSGRAILWCGLIGHLAGAPFVPAYLQYYLLVCPIAAALVGKSATRLLRSRPAVFSFFIAAVFVFALVLRLPELTSKSLNLFALLDLSVAAALVAAVLALAAAMFVGGTLLRRRLATAVLLISLAPGVGRYVVYHRVWNIAERQRQDLTRFGELTSGPVLDGFSGLGCLRPHAGYWWWINHHSLPLMRQEGALPGIVDLIRRKVPSVVVFDEGMRQIGGVDGPLLSGYEQTPFSGRTIFIRRETAPR